LSKNPNLRPRWRHPSRRPTYPIARAPTSAVNIKLLPRLPQNSHPRHPIGFPTLLHSNNLTSRRMRVMTYQASATRSTSSSHRICWNQRNIAIRVTPTSARHATMRGARRLILSHRSRLYLASGYAVIQCVKALMSFANDVRRPAILVPPPTFNLQIPDSARRH
jgi:hypothetical protein